MTTTTDTSLNTLIINQLTAEQYNSITPVENQIYLVEEEYTVEEKINAALQPYSPTEDFANVAFSGDYNDLVNAPSIPAAQMQSDWNQTNSLSPDYIVNKPTLAAVATSGEYADLLNKPTLATVAGTGEYSDLLNKPTLATVAGTGEYSDLLNTPTIDQTYNASSANAQSGVAVAGLIANYSPTSSYANVAFSGDFADLVNVPAAATVDQVYNGSSTNAQSGTAVAGLIANYMTSSEVTNAINTAVSSVYRYKGSVATYADLPSSGQTVGDVYNVEDTGDNYAWTEDGWDKLAGTVDLSNYVTLNTAQTVTNKTINLADNTVIGLATVATSGEYSDLLNLPTIVTPVQSDWAQTDTSALDYIVNKPTLATIATSGEWSDIVNKPTFATVATSGEYSDLLNTPTIPVVEQVYNASSANAMSGVAVANAIDQYATKVVFRTYTD